VVLGDHGIIDQGSWQSIKIKAGSIAKFDSGNRAKDTTLVSATFEKLVRAKDEAEIDLARQSGDSALYSNFPFSPKLSDLANMSIGYYLRFVGSKSLFLLVTCTAWYASFSTIPQYWLQLWTESSGNNTGFYIGGFLFLAFMSWISTSTQMWYVARRLKCPT
jgi:ATP-binding cassette subfamily C (CFTR/MRP) protein 1